MEVVLAKDIHLEAMCKITDDAKAQLKRLGTDQWQYGYPNEEVWKNDILNERAWVAIEEGKVLGAFAFIFTVHETDELDYVKYQVTISDEVSLNDFMDKYEILDQEGKIYTVKERE